MPVRDIFERFANQTTMHGVPHFIRSRSKLSRLFWACVCLASTSMFVLQMSEVLHRFFSYPKKVTVEVVPDSVPFPAISMCNMRNLDFHILNTLNRKFLDNHLPTAHINSSNSFIREYMRMVAKYGELWYKYQETHGHVFQEVFSRTTFSSNIDQEIISLAAVQLKEFVVHCQMTEQACDFSRDFTTFFDPYYFYCFTYNVPDELNRRSSWSLSEGIENGWSSVLFSGSGMLDKNDEIRILPGLHESSSPVSASEGVRVVIHPPNTEPFPFTEGYDVPPGYSASFGVKPRKNLRIQPPHGNCVASNPFTVGTSRNTSVRSGERYRGITCQKMCLQKHVIEMCGCEDTSLPKIPSISAKSCRSVDSLPDSCMHEATHACLQSLLELYNRTLCARQARDTMRQNVTLMTHCNCYPPCHEITYDVSYSLSKWPASGYEGDTTYMDVFYIKNFTGRFTDPDKLAAVKKYLNDTSREKTMQDFARLNVYVADSNVIKTVESPDYTPNQLVSDIGGQLGIWVGISIITLTEVLQLCLSLFQYVTSAKLSTDGSTEHRKARKNSTSESAATEHDPKYQTVYNSKHDMHGGVRDANYVTKFIPVTQSNGYVYPHGDK